MLSHVIKLSKYSNYYDVIYIFHVRMSYIFNIIRLKMQIEYYVRLPAAVVIKQRKEKTILNLSL